MSREGKLEKVVVAVKASKEIPKTALVWALTHVVQPGHCIMLLVVGPSQTTGRRMWGFPRFSGDCASVHRKSNSGTRPEQKVDITASCSQMILQLNNVYDPNKVNVKIKVVSGSPCGVVAAEAKKFHASWVVLDKKLKHEQKSCMEELQCNVVIMKKSQPKVLRLNLVRSPTKVEQQSSKKQEINKKSSAGSTRLPAITPTSSPEIFTATEVGTSSVSSSDQGTSPFSVSVTDASLKESSVTRKEKDPIGSSSDYSEPGTSQFSLLGTDGSYREASISGKEKDHTESSSTPKARIYPHLPLA
ncbi:hypothetical protein OSB04_004826 [Centaurea solstitialis]|uniref:Uncharacterized protein n=1 Tax=Centaurea solstitialis TaxID=347529 RepID=A0AA38TSQ1_9ASTR|nr:hypothetical protein OSB04_004826 [Centaurea solstitialis]